MNKTLKYIEKAMNTFEIVIAVLLLLVIVVRVIEISSYVLGHDLVILQMDFDAILSLALGLVIGLEFTKMLCKHTPESVVDVLLFALARHMVIYNENAVDLLIGVVAIIGLFAAKKFLLDKRNKPQNPAEKPEKSP